MANSPQQQNVPILFNNFPPPDAPTQQVPQSNWNHQTPPQGVPPGQQHQPAPPAGTFQYQSPGPFQQDFAPQAVPGAGPSSYQQGGPFPQSPGQGVLAHGNLAPPAHQQPEIAPYPRPISRQPITSHQPTESSSEEEIETESGETETDGESEEETIRPSVETQGLPPGTFPQPLNQQSRPVPRSPRSQARPGATPVPTKSRSGKSEGETVDEESQTGEPVIGLRSSQDPIQYLQNQENMQQPQDPQQPRFFNEPPLDQLNRMKQQLGQSQQLPYPTHSPQSQRYRPSSKPQSQSPRPGPDPSQIPGHWTTQQAPVPPAQTNHHQYQSSPRPPYPEQNWTPDPGFVGTGDYQPPPIQQAAPLHPSGSSLNGGEQRYAQQHNRPISGVPSQASAPAQGAADAYFDDGQEFATDKRSEASSSQSSKHSRRSSKSGRSSRHSHQTSGHGRPHHQFPPIPEDAEYLLPQRAPQRYGTLQLSPGNGYAPTLKPGILGTVKGLYDLYRKKPYVHGDTPARHELLSRADAFFNRGKKAAHGLHKERRGLFREEMDRVARTLQGAHPDEINWHGVHDGERRRAEYERGCVGTHGDDHRPHRRRRRHRSSRSTHDDHSNHSHHSHHSRGSDGSRHRSHATKMSHGSSSSTTSGDEPEHTRHEHRSSHHPKTYASESASSRRYYGPQSRSHRSDGSSTGRFEVNPTYAGDNSR